MNLKGFQEEIRNLVFIQENERTTSALWKEGIPERLNVYRGNSRTNWIDTLDHDFPLTRNQFSLEEWETLRQEYFVHHPPQHWELNASMMPFVRFLKTRKVKPYIKE